KASGRVSAVTPGYPGGRWHGAAPAGRPGTERRCDASDHGRGGPRGRRCAARPGTAHRVRHGRRRPGGPGRRRGAERGGAAPGGPAGVRPVHAGQRRGRRGPRRRRGGRGAGDGRRDREGAGGLRGEGADGRVPALRGGASRDAREGPGAGRVPARRGHGRRGPEEGRGHDAAPRRQGHGGGAGGLRAGRHVHRPARGRGRVRPSFRRPGRRTAAALACAAVLAAGGGAALVAWGGPEAEQDGAAATGASEEIRRTDLSEHAALDGRLGYRGSGEVLAGGEGVLTRLPKKGEVIGPGGVLYEVDDRPVVLLRGDAPAYRPLGPGVEGEDVRRFEQALAELGYTGFTPDDEYTGL